MSWIMDGCFFYVEILWIHIKTRPTRDYQILLRMVHWWGAAIFRVKELHHVTVFNVRNVRLVRRRLVNPQLNPKKPLVFFVLLKTNLGFFRLLLVLDWKFQQFLNLHTIYTVLPPSLICFMNMHYIFTIPFWFQDLRLKDVRMILAATGHPAQRCDVDCRKGCLRGRGFRGEMFNL